MTDSITTQDVEVLSMNVLVLNLTSEMTDAFLKDHFAKLVPFKVKALVRRSSLFNISYAIYELAERQYDIERNWQEFTKDLIDSVDGMLADTADWAENVVVFLNSAFPMIHMLEIQKHLKNSLPNSNLWVYVYHEGSITLLVSVGQYEVSK